jgi:Uma2 family endonuclease
MATRPERLITYADYVTFPDEPRLEVIAGEAHVVPSPNRRHQGLVVRLASWIHGHLEAHGGGEIYVAPFDVVLTDIDIVQPDLVYISEQDMGVLTEANVRGTPTWAIEILSPSDPSRDKKLKLGLYERTGVPEYWIVDPGAATISVYRLEGDSYGDPKVFSRGDSLSPREPAGFTLNLDDLFGTP